MYFIYILKIRELKSPHEYETQFKIGCTSNPQVRYNNYGGYYGGKEYEMEFIEILSIPDTIKGKYQDSIKRDRLCDYAEAVLHSYYGKYRVTQTSSQQNTEFFINNPFIFPTIDELNKILVNSAINCEISDHLNKDTCKKVEKYNKIICDNPNSEPKPKPNEPIKLDKLGIVEAYLNDPLSFIRNEILNHMDLRSIQKELWDILNKNSDNLEYKLNGIIKWPTGTGKRIAIIMIIMFIFKKYRETNKILRLSIISHRNDICDTAYPEYKLLEKLGLRVIEGYNSNFHKCEILEEESYVLIATHHALIGRSEEGNIKKLQNLKLSMIIYDEVHHITGDEMFEYLNHNKPKYLIGISATPKTQDKIQNERIDKLFGCHYISECTYKKAIEEKWINPCEFSIYTFPKNKNKRDKILDIIVSKIEDRKMKNMWRKKKIIIWIPSPENDINATQLIPSYKEYINGRYPNWKVFTDIKNDEFIKDNLSEDPWCLLLCQKGKEGYDVKGIEFGASIGNSEIHIYVQEEGRSQRIDYEDQLSEFLIFTNYDESEGAELSKQENIINGLTEYMGDNYTGIVANIDEVDISCENPDIQGQKLLLISEKESILIAAKEIDAKLEELTGIENEEHIKKTEGNRRQSIIEFKNKIKQREFKESPKKKQYDLAKKENIRLKLKDDKDYYNREGEHVYYTGSPIEYFSDHWNNWYDFLGIEPTMKEDEFKSMTRKKWIEVNNVNFIKWCKDNEYPHFDYIGLYGKTINEIHADGVGRRR